jgi:hypothetical protein
MAALLLSALLPAIKFPRLLKIIHYRQTAAPEKRIDSQDIIRIVNFVARLKYFVIRNNCLKKSLLLYYFLGKTGLKNLELVIGVKKNTGRLSGHSWLALDSRPFLEDWDSIKEFQIIYSSGARK